MCSPRRPRKHPGPGPQPAGVARRRPLLVLTDVFGATPCNIAQRLVEGRQARLVTGVNLPMLLRTVCYRAEPLDALVQRAVVGAPRA